MIMTMIKDRFLVNYKRFDTESGTYYLYNNSIKKLYNKFNITEDNEEEMLKGITVDMLDRYLKYFKERDYNVVTLDEAYNIFKNDILLLLVFLGFVMDKTYIKYKK